MKMIPPHKLPSFRLGIIEVVTAVAQAAVASNVVTIILKFKKMLLLLVDVCSFIPGWNKFHNTSFNTALSQPANIDRMVYETIFVTKHLQIFLDENNIKT